MLAKRGGEMEKGKMEGEGRRGWGRESKNGVRKFSRKKGRPDIVQLFKIAFLCLFFSNATLQFIIQLST